MRIALIIQAFGWANRNAAIICTKQNCNAIKCQLVTVLLAICKRCTL